MIREYFIERLKEAAEEGWEKALATYEDDVAENIYPLPTKENLLKEYHC